MQFIKMSLLSILIFFIGMSVIVFGNINNSNNYQKINDTEYLLSTDSLPKTTEEDIVSNDDIAVNFVEGDFFSQENGDSGAVNLTVSWTVTDNFFGNPTMYLYIYDGEKPRVSLLSYGWYWMDNPDSPDFSFSQKDDIITLDITINGSENHDIVKDYKFEENHEYMFGADIKTNEEDWLPESQITFTTPSKSVIDFTTSAGKVDVLEEGTSAEIDISWEQTNKDSQIADELYEIDENVQLFLTKQDGKPTAIDNPSDGKLIVMDLDPHTTYSSDNEKWTISGTYYNGSETIKFNIKDINEFTTTIWSEINITLDNTKTVPTESSIIVHMDITNEAERNLNTKFYIDEIKIDEAQVEFIEAQNVSQTGQTKTGWVKYEITGLDYNTEYNLSVTMNDAKNEDYKVDLGSITTIDIYPWVTPVDIVLLVIILVEILASVSIYVTLQKNQKN